MPGPVSCTVSQTSRRLADPPTDTVPPPGVCRNAFATRLESTSRIRTGSRSRIGRSPSVSITSVTPAATAAGAKSEIEALARTVPDSGRVVFVPAFSGLFAPHWRSDARGVIAGLTAFATRGHIARAALEATAYQVSDLCEAMAADLGSSLSGDLRVDGGMIANDLLMQFQADILDRPLAAPPIAETTALGAAYAAGLAVGFWSGLDQLRAMDRVDRRWEPAMDASTRAAGIARWHKGVDRSLGWVDL